VKIVDILPGAKIIGVEVEVPDMIWIWEAFRFLISPESSQKNYAINLAVEVRPIYWISD
jgi:hypothetical protein